MNDDSSANDKGSRTKLRRTGQMDAPASAPEVRPEDVIDPGEPAPKGGVPGRATLTPEQEEVELERGIENSFPASDPPAIVAPHRRRKKPQ